MSTNPPAASGPSNTPQYELVVSWQGDRLTILSLEVNNVPRLHGTVTINPTPPLTIHTFSLSAPDANGNFNVDGSIAVQPGLTATGIEVKIGRKDDDLHVVSVAGTLQLAPGNSFAAFHNTVGAP